MLSTPRFWTVYLDGVAICREYALDEDAALRSFVGRYRTHGAAKPNAGRLQARELPSGSALPYADEWVAAHAAAEREANLAIGIPQKPFKEG